MIFSAEEAVSIPQAVWIACNKKEKEKEKEVPEFQYRKRYGLHAILLERRNDHGKRSFNTASGMDCMQYEEIRYVTGEL